MAEKQYQTVDDTKVPSDDDPEVALVKKASRQGTLNVVGDILADPQVQNTIKAALLRETIKNSIILSCLLLGLLKLYDVSKTVIGFDWKGDLIMSLSLLAIGLIYLIKNMFSLKKNGHTKTSGSTSNAR